MTGSSSSVERPVWDRKVGGATPLSPTLTIIKLSNCELSNYELTDGKKRAILEMIRKCLLGEKKKIQQTTTLVRRFGG